MPVLKSEQVEWWFDHPKPALLAGQVEIESCVSLQNARCWSPKAQLKTFREQGVGLGQITRTWRADGSVRFDSLTEMKQQFPKALAGWSWNDESLYDPKLQLRSLILMNLRNWKLIVGVPDPVERMAMTLAAYNGGIGGLNSDRVTCAATKDCDKSRWWGHVEHTSLKQKTAIKGYGRSLFEINREYPRSIFYVRSSRYEEFFNGL